MEDQRQERPLRSNALPADADNDRRKDERRKCECDGYCYIEMVGWMDRRERVRRDENGFGG